jgi:hypothetical protein
VRLFRREWIVPALGLLFVSASAEASRDDLTAQAAGEMHCNSVTVIQTGGGEYLASGCGKDWTYACDDDGCVSDATSVTIASPTSSDDGDDAAADAVADALTDLACACASAGLASHGSHHHSRTSSEHHHHKTR